MESDNDVSSEKFESHLDKMFTSQARETRRHAYERWSKESARSALATKRPLKAKSDEKN